MKDGPSEQPTKNIWWHFISFKNRQNNKNKKTNEKEEPMFVRQVVEDNNKGDTPLLPNPFSWGGEIII